MGFSLNHNHSPYYMPKNIIDERRNTKKTMMKSKLNDFALIQT